MTSQELGRWAWMETRGWRKSCCTPEAWECTGCSQRLNERTADGQTKDKTGQKGGSDGRKGKKAERKQPSCTQRGKDSRSGKERRKEGGKKKEKGADEAGKTSTELYQRLNPGSVYCGLR